MLIRKIITVSITSTICSILIGIIQPNAFGEEMNTISDFLFLFVTSQVLYLMYIFPAVLIYGVLTSIVSDKAAELITSKRKRVELSVSFILHISFGLVLQLYSLLAAIPFFITDRLLRRVDPYLKWQYAIYSLALPGIWWTLCFVVTFMEDIF